MIRGYFKFWRKVEDSVSWSRGLHMRGLMVTILQRANFREGFFHGQKIAPGQFACSLQNLAEELKTPRPTLHRWLKVLSDDMFISVSNVDNRFTLITVINWDVYQHQEIFDGQQMDNKWTAGGQPVDTIKECKKERIKNTLAQPANSDFDTFWKAYPKKKSKGQAIKAWDKLGKNRPPLSVILAAIAAAQAGHDWRKDNGQYIPHPATWLNAMGWEDAQDTHEVEQAPAGMSDEEYERMMEATA